jgi:hypothetical protein
MNDLFKSVVLNCKYIQTANPIKRRISSDSFCSLSYLLREKVLNHSEKIKLGKGIESFLNELILTNKKWKKLVFDFGFKCQIDDLIINEDDKIIVYSEYNANMALDSQKRDVMYTHCVKLHEQLKKEFPSYKVIGCILNLRFLYKKDIPRTIVNRFNKFKNKLSIYGMNEYLQLFALPKFENYVEYTKFLEFICEQNFIRK